MQLARENEQKLPQPHDRRRANVAQASSVRLGEECPLKSSRYFGGFRGARGAVQAEGPAIVAGPSRNLSAANEPRSQSGLTQWGGGNSCRRNRPSERRRRGRGAIRIHTGVEELVASDTIARAEEMDPDGRFIDRVALDGIVVAVHPRA